MIISPFPGIFNSQGLIGIQTVDCARMLMTLFSISLCFSSVSPGLTPTSRKLSPRLPLTALLLDSLMAHSVKGSLDVQGVPFTSGSDSLTVIYSAVYGIKDFPEVTNIAMVNGIQLNYHDTNIRRVIPRQQFMEDYFDSKYWEYLTGLGNTRSDMAKENLNAIMKNTNQTSGIHTFQWIATVEIADDNSVKRSMRFGFDGKDFLSLEPDRFRWIATNQNAVKTKEKWNSDDSWNKYWEMHLKQGFVQDLKRTLQAGKQYFERKAQPEVFISRSEPNRQDKPLTLSCRVTGFYPVDIEVTWLRNGEVVSETQSSGIRPNHDGTHQIQKEIEISAGDEDQYSCQIEHSSMTEAKLYQWETTGNRGERIHLGMILGILIAAVFGIIAMIIWIRAWKD
ncbi:class I histocompatibility antigen, F10 alpha chain-like isoform X2 [Stegostoma tigrinum]|uniref:class I histocompatibility antigen, F10 alpha chain-like isoform X2 n=1 Tax=Stegostoma tigrinum TaxID=3053191 RepID=UPI00287084FB|nr:class I histocompatibility antigen, F10 alpha chain-like isoform X2 [Stegostoma tigrinum]